MSPETMLSLNIKMRRIERLPGPTIQFTLLDDGLTIDLFSGTMNSLLWSSEIDLCLLR